MNKKIAVIGAGNVGASCALYLAEANLADVVDGDLFTQFWHIALILVPTMVAIACFFAWCKHRCNNTTSEQQTSLVQAPAKDYQTIQMGQFNSTLGARM